MGIKPIKPESICFQDLRMTLQELEGQFISVRLSESCETLQGRIYRVDEGKLILVGVFGTRIIPICSISSIDFGPFAYITGDFIENVVHVVNTATNTVFDLIPVGDLPIMPAITPNGSHVYIPNFNADTISVINTKTNIIQTTISLAPDGSGPSGVAFIRTVPAPICKLPLTTRFPSLIRATNTVLTTITLGS